MLRPPIGREHTAMIADLLPFVAFAFVVSATPGPNNVLVLATAVAHGLRATIPLVLGVVFGLGFMVVVVGMGLAKPLTTYTALHAALRWLGIAWMLVLSWQVARAGSPSIPGRQTADAPLGFWGACAFQWVNPKAWVMALTTATTYTVPGDDLASQVLLLAAVFVLVSTPSVGAWALLGARASRLLASPTRARAFNLTMGLLLVASIIPAALE